MADNIIRRKQVETMIGLSRSTIYSMIASETFPKPLKIGSRAVGWRQSTISTWLNDREKRGTSRN